MEVDNIISSEWTNEDRLAIVNIIAHEMRNDKFLTRDKLIYWAERLHYLATATPEFLEINRHNILGEIVSI